MYCSKDIWNRQQFFWYSLLTIDIFRSKMYIINSKGAVSMTKKKINVILTIMVVFIVLFLAGSFAYENYLIKKQDQEYAESLKDLDSKQEENSAGKTNEESQQ